MSATKRVAGCDFCCPTDEMVRRMIRDKRGEKLGYSILSNPAFTRYHTLVVPFSHATNLIELRQSGAQREFVDEETARLADKLAKLPGSNGYQTVQKSLGVLANTFSRAHFHQHVIPFWENDSGVFAVPNPNTGEGFYHPTDGEVKLMIEEVR